MIGYQYKKNILFFANSFAVSLQTEFIKSVSERPEGKP